MKKYILIIGFLAAFLPARFGFSEVDPVTVLPGTWDGWFEVVQPGANPARTLIIDSVVPKEGGGWIAKSRFGVSGSKSPPVDIDVSRDGEDIVLDWIWGVEKIPIHLKLVGNNKLEGNARPFKPYGSGTHNLIAKFEKK